MENFHGDDIYPHNINKHSCIYQSLPEHQVSKICEYLTKRHVKSCQHMGGLNAFSNYVKTTLNLGSSLKEVDWGGNIDPNYTSSRCMLMEVDWGGKLRVNHIHESMPCESDWGAHETNHNEHSTTRVHWGDHDPSLNPMDEYSISEVDCGAHDPSYFLYLVYIDLDEKPKDFFTQELWGGLPQRTSSTPLIGLTHVEGELVHHLSLQKVQTVWITSWTNTGTPHKVWTTYYLHQIQICVQAHIRV